MAGVPVTLRAEVAAIELPIDEILSLGPGSVIRLGAQADQGVTVFAENVKLARAQPGQQRRPARDPDVRNREEVRMSQQPDITPREALMRLGASTAEAIAKVLEMFVPGAVERGEVTVLADGVSPFANVARGSIASSVSYVDGVTGANVFVLAPAGARGLAGAMGAPPEEGEDGVQDPSLSELEMSAIAEAANQMMAAAAAAIGVVLGQEIAISPPTPACSTIPARPPTSTAPPPTPPRPRS